MTRILEISVDLVESNKTHHGKCENTIVNGALVCNIEVDQWINKSDDSITHPLATIVHELSHALTNFMVLAESRDPKELDAIKEDDTRRKKIEALINELFKTGE